MKLLLRLAAAYLTFGVSQALPAETSSQGEQETSYKGQQVLRFTLSSAEQIKTFESLLSSHRDLYIDTWTDIGRGDVDIRVADATLTAFRNITSAFKTEVFIPNVQAEVDRERNHSRSLLHFAGADPTAPSTFFSDYRSVAEITEFFNTLPGVREISIGKTYEGRNIPGFVFGSGKKNIVFNGGMHAREWIAPAVTSYISYILTGNSADAVQLLQKFTFTVIPVVNVDGYEYTRSKSGDRFWRKNRQPINSRRCFGIDTNRNFNYEWDAVPAEGDPCAENYHGPQPFTAPETKALASYVEGLGNVVSYIDFHSYSQLFMYPYGWTCDQDAPDAATLSEGAKRAVDAIAAKNGIRFTPGDICNTVYAAGGDSSDYFYSKGVTYSYGVELRDKGRYGFNLPAAQIVPSGEETTAGAIALFKYVATQV